MQNHSTLPFGGLYYSDYESVNECLEGVCKIYLAPCSSEQSLLS